jgi:large subunit ribosomal protein L23
MLNNKLYDTIVSPIITEKTTLISSQNKYVFEVARDSTKQQIKHAIEALFNVNVKSINVINVRGKVKFFRGSFGKRRNYKKAIVTISADQSIDVALGVS